MVDWLDAVDGKKLEDFVFVHIWEGHYKVWFFESDKNKINYRWGKINAFLSNKEKDFDSIIDAWYHATGKVREKINKGYIPIPKLYYQMLETGDINLEDFEEKIYNKVSEKFMSCNDADKAKLFNKLGTMDRVLHSL